MSDGTSPLGSNTVHSTGLEKLDQALAEDGFRSGQIITLLNEHYASSQRVLYNLLDDRPVTYISLGRTADQLSKDIEQTTGLPADDITVYTLSTEKEFEDLQSFISDIKVPAKGSVVIDPINGIEQTLSRDLYVPFLQSLRKKIQRNNALLFLHVFGGGPEPELRWVTKHFSDTALEVANVELDSGLADRFIIHSLHPAQKMERQQNRSGTLEEKPDTDMESSEEITL